MDFMGSFLIQKGHKIAFTETGMDSSFNRQSLSIDLLPATPSAYRKPHPFAMVSQHQIELTQPFIAKCSNGLISIESGRLAIFPIPSINLLD